MAQPERPSAAEERGAPPEAEVARAELVWLVRRLTAAHVEGIKAARRLMASQEIAMTCERRADDAIEIAMAQPWDDELVDHAADAVHDSIDAMEQEDRDDTGWASHVECVSDLIAAADDVLLRAR